MQRTSLLFLLMICTIVLSCTANQKSQAYEINADTITVDTIETTRITLLFAGDLMQHSPQIKGALQKDGTYDYTECFRYISSEISEADIAIGNFETTLASAPYSGYPQFCAPDEFLDGCIKAGFDIMLTANNHVCDKSRKGIERTINVMKDKCIPQIGSYLDSLDRKNRYPYILEKDGFRIALLNYTYGTNGIPVPTPNIVNFIDTIQMAADIQEAKLQKPDAIIACMHWGEEYKISPMQSQKDMADWLFGQGVTHIIGSHPHVVEPIELREDSDGNKHVLAYSLGNFVSNQSQEYTYGGMMVKLELEKDTTTRLTDCNYSLYFVTRPVMSGHKQHRVYPVAIPDTLITPAETKLRNQFVNSIRPFLEQNNKNVREVMTFDISSFVDE